MPSPKKSLWPKEPTDVSIEDFSKPVLVIKPNQGSKLKPQDLQEQVNRIAKENAEAVANKIEKELSLIVCRSYRSGLFYGE